MMRMRLVFFLIVALGETAIAQPSMPPFRPITADDTVLVVAPHPDDESLCCGGLIHAARSAGARVAIVWVTNGDGFKWDAIVVEKKIRPRAGAYLELARTYAEHMGLSARAIDALTEGEKDTNGDQRVVLALARLLREAGRLDEALGELKQAVAFDPLNVESWRELSLLFEQGGRRDDRNHALRQDGERLLKEHRRQHENERMDHVGGGGLAGGGRRAGGGKAGEAAGEKPPEPR